MTLLDAAYALDQLAAGQIPELEATLRGLLSLDLLLLEVNCEQDIRDASATLELLVAGVTPNFLTAGGRDRAKAMADAVRKAISRG